MKCEVVQIADAWNDLLCEKKEDAKLGGVRSMIGAPLLREGQPIGVMALADTRVAGPGCYLIDTPASWP